MTVLVQTPETSPNADWSEWLRAYLETERKNLHCALGELLATERQKFERKTSEFELKLAKLTGAVDILRGAAPPPPAKFPSVTAWRADMIYHEREVVSFNGGCYQATKDTARAPGTSDDWTCLAASGSSFNIRGTYTRDEEYKYLDIVIINGSSFVALKDNPGVCPDSGNWHLLASRGSRGQRGPQGAHGLS